jgi:predicted metal-dependent phosphoesterase TrpH
MKIDLHTHSSASDGIKSPAELAEFAVSKGLSALALTDHDTIDGINEAEKAAAGHGLDFIPGIEFSVDYPGGSFHLLGYYIDRNNEDLKKELKWITDMRDKRAGLIVEDLNANGFKITLDQIIAEAGSASAIGRPHIARILLKNGYGTDLNDIFKNFLVKGKPGYVKKNKISPARAFELIKLSGAVAVVAHPGSLGFEKPEQFESFINEMKKNGLAGIECYSGAHTFDQINYYLDVAQNHGMLVTGGSDFHGDKNEAIGYYSEGNAIPYELFESLSDYYKRAAKK